MNPSQDFLPLQPKKLISLWDMILFDVDKFVKALDRLLWEWNQAWTASERKEGQPDAAAHEQQRLRTCLGHLRHYCVWLQATEAIGRIDKFSSTLFLEAPLNYLVISSEIKGIMHSITEELEKRKFAYVPVEMTRFFENDCIFGEDVEKAFPSAHAELKEAGTCRALDLHTAAVFHLMRAAEHCLRELAKHVDAVPQKWPMEFSQWKEVIADIEKKLESKVSHVEQQTRGIKKEADLEFYNGLLADVNHIKVARNRIMHARDNYNPSTAPAIFDDVEKFMKRLASRLLETSQLPR